MNSNVENLAFFNIRGQSGHDLQLRAAHLVTGKDVAGTGPGTRGDEFGKNTPE
jgi:hypothetical protein